MIRLKFVPSDQCQFNTSANIMRKIENQIFDVELFDVMQQLQ